MIRLATTYSFPTASACWCKCCFAAGGAPEVRTATGTDSKYSFLRQLHWRISPRPAPKSEDPPATLTSQRRTWDGAICAQGTLDRVADFGPYAATFCRQASIILFLGFKTQATWLRANNDTSPVLERLWLEKIHQKETNQAKVSSLFPRAHIESQENPSFRLWPSRFRKVARPPSDLLNFSQNKEAHKRNEGTPSFQRRHTMFKL